MLQKSKKLKNNERKLCFGSLKGRFENVEKSREHSLIWKGPNKIGYTLFASRTPRDKEFHTQPLGAAPPVGTYDIEPQKPIKQSVKPFGVGTKLRTEIKWLTPGPGSHSFFKRQVNVCTAFGRGNRIIIPLVKIHCGPFNMSKCFKCGKTPIGDYWQRNSPKHDLCRPCMNREIAELKKCSTNVLVRFRRHTELQQYYLMRYCGFFHDHHCTKAAVQTMPTKYLLLKIQKENYLASYGLE